MSPSIVAFTELSWMPRFCATAATPAVRQLARPTSTYSTGVGPLSSDAKISGWSASKDQERAVALLAAEAEEVVDCALAVGASDPLVAGAPGELRPLRGVHQRRAGIEQRLHVYSVVGGDFAGRHPSSLGRRSRTTAAEPISTLGRLDRNAVERVLHHHALPIGRRRD